MRGFTLIEILVSVTIFVLVIGAVSGIFASTLKSQRYGLANQAIMDSVSYGLEYMSRALRMAKKEINAPSCLSQNGLNYEISHDGNGIKFLNYLGTCQEFYLEGARIYQKKGIEILPLTPQKIEVISFRFNLSGASEDDNIQPRVTFALSVKGRGQKAEEQVEMKVQTTVSQRELDIK